MLRMVVDWLRRHSHVNWALADQVMVSGSNFLTGILLARYLGLEAFGVFTLAWMAVLFVNSIQFSLISSPMMSIGPKQAEDKQPAYYGAVLLQQLIFSMFSAALMLMGIAASARLFPEWGVEPLIWPLVAASLAFQVQDFIRRYFFTCGRSTVAFINDAVSYLGQIAVLAWLVFETTLTSAIALWTIAATSVLAIILGFSSFESLRVDRTIFRQTLQRHWVFSKWLTASALLQWASGNLFIVAAGSVLGAAAVGAMKAAQNIVGVTHILFQGLENIVPIQASRHFSSGGMASLTRYLRKVTIAAAIFVIPLLVLALVFPAFWLELVYGAEYAEYAFVLQWYAVIYVVMLIVMPLRIALRAQENTRPIFQAYLAMSIFSVVCALPAATYLGLHGVLAGILVTYMLLMTITWRSLLAASGRFEYRSPADLGR